MKSGPSCAIFLSFPDTLRFQRVFRFATQLSQPSAISRPRSNTIHIYLDWHIYFIAIVAVGVYLGVLVHIVNNQLHKIENTMPAVFNPQRPLTKSEYGRRRDETTTVELNKLMASRAYKQFAKTDDSCKPSAVPLLVAAAFAAVILSCIVGISMMGGKAEIAAEIVQVRWTVDHYLIKEPNFITMIHFLSSISSLCRFLTLLQLHLWMKCVIWTMNQYLMLKLLNLQTN